MKTRPSGRTLFAWLLLAAVAIGVQTEASVPVEQRTNLALGAPYWVNQSPSDTYPDAGGELTDGRIGSLAYTDPAWQGHLREEFRVVTVDLGAVKSVHEVRVGFLLERGAGIFLPDQVLVQTSVNGRDWSPPVTVAKAQMGDLSSPQRKVVSFPLDTAARYVRVAFFVEVWVFIDEIEVWGIDEAIPVDDPTDLLPEDDPYLGRTGQAVTSRVRLEQLSPAPVDAYMPPASAAAGGARHMVLIYTHPRGSEGWTLTHALPYVAYSPPGPSGTAAVPPKWEDWFFDTFLFLALYTPTGKVFGSAAHGGSPAVWEDWLWFLDYLFKPGEQLDAFEQAIARAKGFIADPDYKAKVALMIPYPIPSTTDFGDPLGAGTSLSFTALFQGEAAQSQARLTAVKAYLDALKRRWEQAGFQHLEWVGMYWLAEEINGPADLELLREVAKVLEAEEKAFFWIPYFRASGWNLWQEAGFTAAMYQPNFMFNTAIPVSRLGDAAADARRFGLGIEIEADETVLQTDAGRQRYYRYLRAGVEHGWPEQALHGYYQGRNVLFDAFTSRDPAVRRVYDATYEYVKGIYDPARDM